MSDRDTVTEQRWVAFGPAGAVGSIHRTDDGFAVRLMNDAEYRGRRTRRWTSPRAPCTRACCRDRSGRTSASTDRGASPSQHADAARLHLGGRAAFLVRAPRAAWGHRMPGRLPGTSAGPGIRSIRSTRRAA